VACACIDIGSNTTRLLVAERRDGGLRELLTQRAFTRIGKSLGGEVGAGTCDALGSERAVAAALGAEAVQRASGRDLAQAAATVWLGHQQARRVRADVDAGEAQVPQTAMIRPRCWNQPGDPPPGG
jgi:hypothetical protein